MGAEEITEQDIDEHIADVNAWIAEAKDDPNVAAEAKEGLAAPARTDMVMILVLGRLCEADGRRRRVSPTASSPATVQRAQIVPNDADFFELRLGVYGCLFGIRRTPRRLRRPTPSCATSTIGAFAAGLLNQPFGEIKEQLAALQEVAPAVATKRLVTDLVGSADIRVNPRYRPLEFLVSDLGSGQPLVVAVVGEPGSDAVRDIA